MTGSVELSLRGPAWEETLRRTSSGHLAQDIEVVAQLITAYAFSMKWIAGLSLPLVDPADRRIASSFAEWPNTARVRFRLLMNYHTFC